MRPVNPSPRERLAGLLPAIKADWLARLQSEPMHTPLGRPATLAFLMEATLQQWTSGLGAADRVTWLKKCTPLAGSVHRHCACGLNPLLRYYTTGETAIACVAGTALGADGAPALAVFRDLARREIDVLCSVCIQPGHAGCALVPSAPSRHEKTP